MASVYLREELSEKLALNSGGFDHALSMDANMNAPNPTQEPARLAAVDRYSVLDSSPEDAFDDLTQLASFICAAPIALVSLVDRGRIWFTSKVKLDVSEISSIDTFCSRAMPSDSLVIVPDASVDDRLASHPYVRSEPKLRFYAGTPLIDPRGQRIGSLCVIDTVPRHLDENRAAALECVARTIITQLELRRSVIQATEAEQLQRDIHSRTESQIEGTAQLAAAHHSLQLLTQQLLQAQEDERRRIARELHDETGQVLAALSMSIDGLQVHSSRAYRARIAECKELLRLAISEIRNLSYLLHPPLMDAVGLSSAVAEYVRGFEERSGIKVEVEVSPELGRLEQDREVALFRIIQESFGNIRRHSGSPTASLSLSLAADTVVLEIHDQGKGFHFAPEDTTHFGLGIRSMQERVRIFGGTLQLRSTDAGTTVRAELPKASMPARAAIC